MDKYDLVIIGSGPGGYIGAIRAAQLGMNVAVIERDKPGGVCLNWGCIPSKAILKSAYVFQSFQHAKDYGITAENLTVDYAKVIQKSRKAASTLSKGVEYLFKKNKITLISGTGKFITPNKIAVSGVNHETQIEAYNVLLCTGTVPRTLPFLEVDGSDVMTSDEAIISTDIPESIAIIGGGAIGVEFAYIYNSFGSKVTIFELMEHILPESDIEISKELEKNFKRQGITVFTETKITKTKHSSKGIEIVYQRGEKKSLSESYDKVLVAVGRKALIEPLGLDTIGVELDSRGYILTDHTFMTSVTGVYAIGDVIGPPLLAHKASEEAVLTVETIAGMEPRTLDYDNIPNCIYCKPEVASIGLTEQECLDRGLTIDVGRFPFKASGKAVATGDTQGFVKMIADRNTGEILGTHIIGDSATELISEISLAKTLESTPLEIAETSHPHPTLSEALMESALSVLGRSRNI